MTIGNAIMEPMQVHKILENPMKKEKKRVKELLKKVNLRSVTFLSLST